MLKVIGAGLPRTGTLSQKAALEMLGLGPCYHMVNVLGDLSNVEVWSRVRAGALAPAEALVGFGASVDWPGSFYYEELMQAFPDAPVLLSVRDGEAWETSMRQTIYAALYGDSLMHDLGEARGRIDADWRAYTDLMMSMWSEFGITDGRAAAPGSLARAMETYNDRVRATVPAGRLIEWSPSDGWGPLCAALELEVPTAPFPRLNDSRFFATQLIDAALSALVRWRDSDREATGSRAPAPA